MDPRIANILFILVLVAINGYFAASEIALISARRPGLKERADAGSKGARVALALQDRPTQLLATIQIGITILGMLASATAAVSLAQPVGEWLGSIGVPSSVAAGLGVFVVTLIISYVTLVVGELAPKRLGLVRAERVAIGTSRPIAFIARAAKPLVWLLTVSTNAVAALLGIKPGEGAAAVTEEEIRILVQEQGSLLEAEKRLIGEIFELGDTVVREIMVPRVDMVLAEDTATVGDAASLMQRTGYSRLPVYHEDRDRIVGVAIIKDLLGPLSAGKGSEMVTSYMRDAVFVPETKRILPLLDEMQRARNHLCIVADEHGGTAGLVTLEDIVEEIVGEVYDEFDRDLKYITAVTDDEWMIDGRLPTEDALDQGWPVEESDEYETVAGWLTARLGHIPSPGESLVEGAYTFLVVAVRRSRVTRIRVTGRASAEEPGSRHAERGFSDGAGE